MASDRGSPSRSRSRSPNRNKRLYVGNLAYEIRWQDLKDYFGGEVTYADVMMSQGRSKGCGIVEFANPGDAQRAIEELNETPMNGRNIFVREDREAGSNTRRNAPREREYREPREPREPRERRTFDRDVTGRQLFVGNLPFSMRWQDMKDMFKECGSVDRADVFMDHQGRSKGCGIVVFQYEDDAQAAIEKFNGTEIFGRRIDVRLDQRTERS